MRLKSSSSHLAIIVLGAVLLAILAFYINSRSFGTLGVNEKFLPTLEQNVKDLTYIHLITGTEVTHLDKQGNNWVVREASNAPANIANIRFFIRALAESTLLEAKTKDPERYSKLGLDDKQALRVQLYTKDNKEPLVDFYLGNLMPKQEATYGRIQGNPESWLISGIIHPVSNPEKWIDPKFTPKNTPTPKKNK
jgi:hypothetical protein